MKNRSWKREKSSRQDSQESNNSAHTTTSSSIREFELFQQFCSDSSPTWEVPCEEANEVIYSWDASLNDSYAAGMITERPSSPPSAQELKREFNGAENRAAAASDEASDRLTAHESNVTEHPQPQTTSAGGRSRRKISVSGKLSSDAKNTITCRVQLLNNTEHSVTINKKAKGRLLFDAVCEQINLVEKDHFSCSYRDKEGYKIWLNMDKKLSKQIGDGPLQLTFEVKFYPSDFEYLQEDLTRYLICLQVRKDVASGRLPCSFMTHALLGSYIVQSEFGDRSTEKPSLDASYIKGLQFAPDQTEELLGKVVELHQTHRTLSPSESDLLYLMNASKLALYGVELHLAKDSDGELVTLGICSSGLLTFCDRLRTGQFIWPRILRISYRGRSFYILVRPNDKSESDSNISYKFPTHRIAKRFWRTVVEFHTFFRLKESEPAQPRFFLPFGSSKFQYSGRTQHQSREVSSQIDRPGPTFDRTLTKSVNVPSKSTVFLDVQTPSNDISVVIESDKNQQQNCLAISELNHIYEQQSNSCRESPTISCSSRLTSNYSQRPPTTPSRCSSRSDSQMVKMQTRTVTCAASGSDIDDFGMLISAHSHSSRTHTIETTTYQTERDGVVETRVEKKVLLGCDGENGDQNMVLADVIRSVADVDPSLSVEKIEIQTRSEIETS